MIRSIYLSSLCEALHLNFRGSDICLHGLNLCDRKTVFDKILSYVTSKKYVAHVRENKRIACMVLREDLLQDYVKEAIGRSISYILSDEPEKTFYDIHTYLYKKTDFYEKYDFQAKIGMDCEIDKTAIIQEGAIIGSRVRIGPLSVIRRGSVIGDDVEIGCHTVIGGEGFQIIREEGRNRKIVHVGGTTVGAGSSIGDHVVIANSLFENTTQVGRNVMINNFVHIAHNVVIEDAAVITAGVILTGGSHIGRGAWIAPNASVRNKVVIGDKAIVGMGSVVLTDVQAGNIVAGNPAKRLLAK